MKPILELITLDQLKDLASRSHFRYGQQIAEDAEIKFVKINTFNRIAEVKQGSREVLVVELMSTPKGFRWKCSCSSRKEFFCEHCVAVGLISIRK